MQYIEIGFYNLYVCGNLGVFLGWPYTRVHFVLLLVGLGSVKNCKVILLANLWQVSCMICMQCLVGARRSRSSQKPNLDWIYQPSDIQYNTTCLHTKITGQGKVIDHWLVPFIIEKRLDFKPPQYTQANRFSYTKMMTLTTMIGKPLMHSLKTDAELSCVKSLGVLMFPFTASTFEKRINTLLAL